MGLLLLRLVVGGALSVQGIVCLIQAAERNPAVWLSGVLALVSGPALIAGFATPASGAVAAVTTLLIVATCHPATASMLIDHGAALLLVVDAAVLVLLGPGALSLDARLFGRREIIIPHDPPA